MSVNLPSKIYTRLDRIAYSFERNSSILVFSVMVLLACFQIVTRKFFNYSVLGVSEYLQHGTLWLTFAGASLAAHRGRHLKLSTGVFLPGRFKNATRVFHASTTLLVFIAFCIGGISLAIMEMENPITVAPFLPTWGALLCMPVFLLIAGIRIFYRQSKTWYFFVAIIFCTAILMCIGFVPPDNRAWLVVPGLIILVLAVLSGAPLFVFLGGSGLLLFFTADIPLSAVPSETYRMVASPNLPTIPLFTLAGCILADGGASGRLVGLFRSLFGWMPGGIAIAATVVCAFFTTFTGASGVTILALGGILLPILLKEKYNGKFSLGLVTSSGSVGLLFPPALPIILYAVVAGIPIDKMFIAGLTPGLLLLFFTIGYAIYIYKKEKIRPIPFSFPNILEALKVAKWDIAIPFIILFGIFGGLATVVETAAVTVLYTVCIECFVHRKLSLFHDLPRTITKAVILIGGIMIILGFAFGFTSYLVDAEIPSFILEWVENTFSSKILFLIALNIFLVLVGCIMDIFSAIVVIVPIMIPLAALFGIDPVHLGIIFLVNMELGYLTPPVGLNLFLAAFRFSKPLTEIYRP
ncbi:MAG: TRAP transporter large permease subunit, partial [Fibrobacteria bacterium]|nr:TRAP transporter large permease subunit [Fibrobacteria bacterium]